MAHNPASYAAKDIGWQALGPAIACTALATIIVAIRWYTRLKLSCSHGLDDFVITLSLAVSWTMTGVIAAEVQEGVGVYSKRNHAAAIAQLDTAANVCWILTVNITKASILVQYLRIFRNRNTTVVCIILLVLLLPVALWGILGGTLLCLPFAKLWKPQLPGHCLPLASYWLSTAAIDIALDFIILMLPLPAISSLRLGSKQRFMLFLFFFLGFCVCGFSIARLVTVHVIALDGDLVLSGIWAIIWSTVEANVGIICASLLALKPLVARLFPDMTDDDGMDQQDIQIHISTTASSQDAILARPSMTMTQRSPEGWNIRSSIVRSFNRTQTSGQNDMEGPGWLRNWWSASQSHVRDSITVQPTVGLSDRRNSLFMEHC